MRKRMAAREKQRARPSWIIRGACPLHDLMEVREQGKKKKRKGYKGTSLT
jgi:hypothetical protein